MSIGAAPINYITPYQLHANFDVQWYLSAEPARWATIK